MDPGYRIARARPEQVSALNAVERAAARRFEKASVALSENAWTSLDALCQAQADERLWVALDPTGEVAGFALALRSPAFARAHLAELDVHPDHGRRGLGAALVETVCSWAREEGLRAVTLTTFREVLWNGPWYRRIGFAEIPEADLDSELGEMLRAEAENGLDPSQRVAMSRLLD